MSYNQIDTKNGNGLVYVYSANNKKDGFQERRARCCECKELTKMSVLMVNPSRHFCPKCWKEVVEKLNFDIEQMVVAELL